MRTVKRAGQPTADGTTLSIHLVDHLSGPRVVALAPASFGHCNFAGGEQPVCLSCTPRTAVTCARCGEHRPAQARWPEGPVCDPCYTAALRNRGPCAPA